MKNPLLGVICVIYAVACSDQSLIHNDRFSEKSFEGSIELYQHTENGQERLLSTDALNVKYDVYGVLNNREPALFFFEMWEFGNVLSIYNIEQDDWILRNYKPVHTEIEISKSENHDFIIFLSDERFTERVPYFVLPVAMRVLDDKKVVDIIHCDSQLFSTSVKRSEEFLSDNQARLKKSTKSIISDHLQNLTKRCN